MPILTTVFITGGAELFTRSKATASDWAPSIWGAAEFLFSRTEIQILVLIQVTSPYTHPNHLRAAVKKIQHPKAFDCVFSVTR